MPKKSQTFSNNIVKADRILFKLAKKIEILDKIAWPSTVKNDFLASVKKNNLKIPVIKYKKVNYTNEKYEIKQIEKLTKEKTPIAKFIRETANSYKLAIDMIEQRGQQGFLDRSIELYGTPREKFSNLKKHNALEVAQKILKRINTFDLDKIISEDSYCILANSVKIQIDKLIADRFPDWNFDIKLSNKIQSKAAANINRMRIRENCCFADFDIKQLFQHEILVHVLTIRNGRTQKIKTLGLATPRTTVTQEGLAVFSEFVSGSMDIVRLSRISARVVAIDMALNGANFIDVYNFFLETGQSDEESYYSTARVFRGGNPKGGLAFTKDAVYLRGLVEVHNFFLNSLKTNNYNRVKYLVAGRMNVGDIKNLETYFESGDLNMPKYEPDWLKEPSLLLAFLISSNVMNSLGI